MQNKKTIDFNAICKWFKDGEKPKDQWKIGTEHEKFLFKKNNFKRLGYEDENGIRSILEEISKKDDWKKICEKNNIIGLKHISGSSISLEPGGQFELSGAPLTDLHMTCNEAGIHLNLMKTISEKLDFIMLGLGHDPKWKKEEISWMPKQRYEIMRKYMPKVGNYGLDMMIRTCTIQVNLDYSDEMDMIKKFQSSLALQPIATALFSNSPFVDGKLSNYLSARAHAWTDTDQERAGFPEIIFQKDFGYEAWAKYLFSVPMYFIYNNEQYIDVAGKSFKNFFDGNLEGFIGQYPDFSDWEDHVTVAFPEVRLKQYLEMRGADGGPWNRICALPAFWVGILYDEQSLNDAYNLSTEFMNVSLLTNARLSAAQFGLDGKIGKYSIYSIAKKLLDISYEGLKRRNYRDKKGISETQYLDPLFNILQLKKTGAQELIESYKNKWKENIDHIFK